MRGGRDGAGAATGLRVSGLVVRDLQPLLDRLRQEEARRPGLLEDGRWGVA